MGCVSHGLFVSGAPLLPLELQIPDEAGQIKEGKQQQLAHPTGSSALLNSILDLLSPVSALLCPAA